MKLKEWSVTLSLSISASRRMSLAGYVELRGKMNPKFDWKSHCIIVICTLFNGVFSVT
jgi:hypothetical protein